MDARRQAVSVFVDIEVIIDRDARSARLALAALDARLTTPRTPDSLRYIGTASGLAGLIVDIHVLGIADGVALLPLVEPDGQERIVNGVLPLLLGARS